MPARAEPTAKVKEMVRLRLMPMSWAAPMSSLTARMALPSLVRCTRKVRATMDRMDTAMVSRAA